MKIYKKEFMPNIAVVVKEWLLPILIQPIFAVFLGAYISKKQIEKQEKNNEKFREKKILILLKKETEIFLQYQNEKDIFRSHKYMMLNLVK